MGDRLFCLLALEVAKKLTPLRGRRLVLAALVVGLAAGWACARWAPIRSRPRHLAPAPLVFALVFATLSPTAEPILPAGPAPRGGGDQTPGPAAAAGGDGAVR